MKEYKDPAEESLEKRLFPEQEMPEGFNPDDFPGLEIESRPLNEMDDEVRTWCEEIDKLIGDILEPDPSYINQITDEN